MNGSKSSKVEDALSVQAQAAYWLRRTLDQDWAHQDQTAFDIWLTDSTAHKLAYWRLRAAWSRSERLVALQPLSFSPRLRSRRSLVVMLGAAIAAATISAFFVGDVSWVPRQTLQTFETPIGGHQVLTLSDGSRIELNTNTTVRIGLSEKFRTVVLEKGEAFFQVEHDPRRPFVVTIGPHRIIDIGTKFLVRADAQQLKVTLVEGKARLESANAGIQALLLTPGDTAIATPTTMSVTARPSVSLSAQLGWRRGLLIFGNASLGEVAAEFNRYNATKLLVADATTAKIAIGGTFQANDVRTFAEIARNLLRLNVKTHNGTILISR